MAKIGIRVVSRNTDREFGENITDLAINNSEKIQINIYEGITLAFVLVKIFKSPSFTL